MAPVARWKDLCLDVTTPEPAAFWAALLGLRREPTADADPGRLTGTDPGQTVWLCQVPEARTVKNRVHLDVVGPSLDPVLALGATPLTTPGEFAWTTFSDPVEGQEFCVFVRADTPGFALKDVVVDCLDPGAQAAWWADVWGGVAGEGDGYAWVDAVPGAPFESVDFVPVPEPKTVKNRVHWDVVVLDADAGIAPLLERGATLVRARDPEIRWDVLADPEGNEFCAFAP